MSKAKANLLQRSRPILIALLVVACCLGTVIPLARIPSVSEQLAAKPQGLVVTLTQPADGSQWPLLSTIRVSAEAAGARPAQSLELWVDGNLLHKVITSSGRAAWTWTLEGLYQHTLVARSTDDQGRTYNSNVVRVTAVINPHPGFSMLYAAKAGDTLASVAANFGVDPSQFAASSGPLDPNAPIAPGTKLKVPFSLPPIPVPPGGATNPPAPGPSGPTQAPSPNPPNKFVFWASQFLQPQTPAAPDLALSSSGCSLNVIITDHAQNELGFNIYRLDPNAQGFKQIATLGANGSTTQPIQYVDPNLYGAFNYYVSAFNAGGETQSNTAAANVSAADCLTPFWSGSQAGAPSPSSPTGEQLQFPPPAKYDKAYYYLSMNDGPHQRVPADPNQFLSLPAGVFNAGDQIKALVLTKGPGPLTVDFDAWGWNAGALIHIGDFKKTILTQLNLPSFVTPSLLQICDNPPCFQGADVGGSFVNDAIGNEFKSWQFRWQASSPDITGGLAQVSILPFDKTCGAYPSGLVWSGAVPASAKYFAWFNLDLAPLHTKPVKVGSWTISNNVGFYIRVLPQADGQTVCQPSNTVTWVYKIYVPPTAKPTPKPLAMSDPYTVLITSVTPYQFASPADAGCVQVVKNDYYIPLAPGEDWKTYETNVYNSNASAADKQMAYWFPWAPGAEMCPSPPPPPSSDDGNILDQFVSLAKATVKGVEDGLDAAVHGYDEAKTWLIENVANEIPICNQSAGCHQALGVALDAGLAAVGLPPNLPSTQDVLKAAEGDIADEVVSQMGSYCPDKNACKAAVQAGLDDMIAHNQQAESNSLCSSTTLCIPPQAAKGIITQPWPTATDHPAIATVVIGRHTDAPDSKLPPFSCGLSLYSDAVNDSWNGQTGIPLGDYHQLFWTGEHIEGSLFKTAQLGIPGGMAPGDSRTIPVFLSPQSDPYPGCWSCGFWIQPHGSWDLANLPDGDPDSDDWSLLYRGSNATFTAYMTCSSPSTGKVFPNLDNIFKHKLDVTFPK